MIGQTAAPREVKARWAYDELGSSRFGEKYRAHVAQALFDKAAAGVSFEALGEAEQDELVEALGRGRGAQFVAKVDRHPRYVCAGLTKGQLAQLWAIPLYHQPAGTHCIPYYDFYIGPRRAPSGDPMEDRDARIAAQKVPAPSDRSRHQPGVVIGVPGYHVLLEGYLRSVLFMRDADLSERFRVWVPG